ncbi:unnamed protein product [Caenorhabditis brenneri]
MSGNSNHRGSSNHSQKRVQRPHTYWSNGHAARVVTTEPKRVLMIAPKPRRKRDYLAESLENYQRQLAELRPFEGARGPVHFTIRTTDGKETPFKANSSELVYALRVNIKKELNVRPCDQKLIFHASILQDRQTIQQAGIFNGAVVQLLVETNCNKLSYGEVPLY